MFSWFAGIGGFDLAFRRAGHAVVGACEIDAHARKVYAARLGTPAWFPHDIREVTPDAIPEADLWCGGFPCQDLSVAGKRAGIRGERSGLIWTLLDLVVVERPTWLLLENVPGLLSGRDDDDDLQNCDGVDDRAGGSASWFGTLLGAMDDIGYDVAWCVLDARWFGVPQRRRRVFILACRPGAGDPGAVLALSEGGGGHPAPGGTARADVAGALGGSSAGAGWRLGRDEAAAGHVVVNALRGGAGGGCGPDDNDAQGGRLVLVEGDSAASTPALPRLRAGCGRGGETAVAVFGGNRTSGERTVAAALSSHGGPHGRLDFETENFVVATGTGAGWWKDAAEDGVRLRAQAGGTPENVVVTPLVKVHRGGVAGTEQDYDRWEPSDVAPTLNDGDMADKRQTTIVAFNVHAAESGAKERHAYATGQIGSVRRLTPTEAERLQGFPDGWTCTCGCEPYRTAACRCADGPRYRALGNAVAVPVVGWIARRMDGASR